MNKLSKHLRALIELVLFALFGAIMFVTAQVDIIPNVHPLALFIVSFTAVYRFRAVIPVYVYVMLEGLYGGFNTWWIPYLYVWTVLWAMAMLIPRGIKTPVAAVLMAAVAGLHGIAFGLLYSPFQCYFMFKGDWDLTLAWLIQGLPFDGLHALGNIVSILIAIPFIKLLSRLSEREYPYVDIKTK